MELYKTVKKEAEAEQIIEKSRFTAHVKPVETKEEADEFIASVKSLSLIHICGFHGERPCRGFSEDNEAGDARRKVFRCG